jgi:hypothetical protein
MKRALDDGPSRVDVAILEIQVRPTDRYLNLSVGETFLSASSMQRTRAGDGKALRDSGGCPY